MSCSVRRHLHSSTGSKGLPFIDRWVGYLGSGIFGSGFDFIDEVSDGKSQWAEYQLEKDLIQVQRDAGVNSSALTRC